MRITQGKSSAIISVHTGTSDFYLIRAVLQGGLFPAVITASYNRNFAAHDAYAVVPELAGAENVFSGGGSTVWWAQDCYFGASALALLRVMQHFSYTLVAADGEGKTVVFVRNDLLPARAHMASLMSSNWVSKVVKHETALYAPCHRRLWVRVTEGAGAHGEWDRVLLDHEEETAVDANAKHGVGKGGGGGHTGEIWARNSSVHVPFSRTWKVVGEGPAAGWAGTNSEKSTPIVTLFSARARALTCEKLGWAGICKE